MISTWIERLAKFFGWSGASFWIGLGLFLGSIAIYCGTAANDFVQFDDQVYVTENHNLERDFFSNGLEWALTTDRAHNWHPLTWISHMIDVHVAGRRPAWHHAVNVLLHASNALVLFLVLMRLTQARWPSALVAALFAVHPLNVESVAWVAERKNVLSTLFWFLTIGAYGAYVKGRRPVAYVATALLFAFGLMAKPMLVTLPCVLLLLDYWPLGRDAGALRGRRGPSPADRLRFWLWLFVEKVPLLALSAGASYLTFRVQDAAQSSLDAMPLAQRVANALVSYIVYLRKAFWPGDLSVYYPHPRDQLAWWQAIVAAIVLSMVTVIVLGPLRGRRYLAVGWLWYLGTLVPVIGLVQVGVQSMADRYAYVPMVGIIIMVSWGLADLSRAWSRRVAWLPSAVAAVLAVLALLTVLQVRVWRNTETLFTQSLAVNSENAVAHHGLGVALIRRKADAEAVPHLREAARLAPAEQDPPLSLAGTLYNLKRYDEAIAVLDDAVKRWPQLAAAHNLRGLALMAAGDLPLAIADFKLVLDQNPNDSRALANLGVAYVRRGKLDLGAEVLEAAVRIDPSDADARINAGKAQVALGHLDAAIDHFRRVIRDRPSAAEAHRQLGLVLIKAGRASEAVGPFQEVVRIEPNGALAHYHQARLLVGENRLPQAIRECHAALRLKPDWPVPANYLAWLLATHPDATVRNGAESLMLAEQACRHAEQGQAFFFLDTLAAAYAEVGRFDDAVKAADQAFQAAIAADNIALATEIQQRRRLYAAGQPYRENTPP